MASPAASSGPAEQPPSASDTVLRNALRYTISAREYASLHKYILSKSGALRKRTPSVGTVDRFVNGDRQPSSRGASTARRKDDRRADEAISDEKAREKAAERASSIVGADDFNARAVRHSIRVFVATGVAMKLWAAVMRRLVGRKE